MVDQPLTVVNLSPQNIYVYGSCRAYLTILTYALVKVHFSLAPIKALGVSLSQPQPMIVVVNEGSYDEENGLQLARKIQVKLC